MSRLTVHAVGDVILDTPEPGRLFRATAPVLQRADLAIAHVEVPHTTSREVWTSDVPARPAHPDSMRDIAAAGFGVVTLAGNHIADSGPRGIADTIDAARRAGLPTTGAGADLAAAREPAVLERAGRRVGVMSVNCVGPRDAWAGSRKAGADWVEVVTHYEPIGANPGGPPRVDTFVAPGDLAGFRTRVRKVAASVDVLIVALHKGLVHVPAEIAAYEHEIARAAIEEGATAVVSHHAHILRGVELHLGRPIFHGLGNFVTATTAMTPTVELSDEQRRWARRRRRLFGFEPDPAMPHYPFHPESRHTAIAVIEIDGDDVAAAVVPCWIDGDAQPVPVGAGCERGVAVAEYLRRITAEAELATRWEWDGDLLRVV